MWEVQGIVGKRSRRGDGRLHNRRHHRFRRDDDIRRDDRHRDGRRRRGERQICRRPRGFILPNLRPGNCSDIVGREQKHLQGNGKEDTEPGKVHMAPPAAGDPGQQHAADAGPVETGFLQQNAQEAADKAADRIQNDIVYIRDAVIEELGEFQYQGKAG